MQAEIPILDGSAAEFCSLIESAGIEEQGGHVDEIVIDRRYEIGDRDGGGEYICIEPADVFGVRYILDYPAPVGRQEHVFQLHRHRALQDRDRPGAHVRLPPRDRDAREDGARERRPAATTAS